MTSAGRQPSLSPQSPETLKDLYDRKVRAMTRRRSFGRASAEAHARLRTDGACEVDQGARTLLVDLPREDGGVGTGPHPGELMRASIAACLAIGYRLWGARLEIPIDDVTVDIVCEYDVSGQLGIADVPVGWQRMIVDVTITSPASETDIRRLVAHNDRLSPMLANVSSSVERLHRLMIVRTATTRAENSEV